MPSELARNRVEARPGIPLPNGLFSVAAVLPIDDVHDENGVDWFSLGCGPANVFLDCPTDEDLIVALPYFPELVGSGEEDKIFGRPEWLTAPPVTVYAGVECSAPGWTYEEAVERARTIINIGEQAALETWTWAQLMASATDVSAEAGDGGVVGRLAVLEAALASVYAGVGVVHVPVLLASYMAGSGLISEKGGKLVTRTGNLVSIGAYPGTDPSGNPPDDDHLWMAISGPVTVRQGQIEDVPDGARQGIDIRRNDRLELAERTSVVQIECGAFATIVTKTSMDVTINTGDITLGAVEMKDADTDTRAKVGPGDTIQTTDNAVAVSDPNVVEALQDLSVETTLDPGSNSTSVALESGRVVKASAGKAYGISGYNSAVFDQYIQVFDAAAVPADGATPTLVILVPAMSPFALDWGDRGRAFANGISVSNSTTLATKTAGAADVWIDAQYV